MSKSGGKQTVINYYLSMHYGVCLGVVDKVIKLNINEKDVPGLPVQTDNAVVKVDQAGLFGGPKKGGGVLGTLYYLFGKPDQLVPATLAQKMGRTPETMTGYRGMLSLVFIGVSPFAGIPIWEDLFPNNQGFFWSSNLPQVPSTKVTVQRSSKGLHAFGDDPMIGNESNPAHIIYECFTDVEWGAGYSDDDMNVDMFLSAAQKLREEDFGLSFIWNVQTDVESFINEVLQHISATLVYDLASGKWGLKLLRGDYDVTTLPELNPSNSNLISFQRKGYGESINEIVVTWTNPDNEKEETVTQHDNSGISIEANVVSDPSRSYPGVRSQDLALRLAERDLRQASAPLAAVETEVDHSLWYLKPGDVVRFNWNELDENGDVFHPPIIMRVLKVQYGRKTEPRLRLSLLEDIFSFDVSAVESVISNPSNPSQEPVDVQHIFMSAAPYFVVASKLGDTAAQAAIFPQTNVMLLAAPGLTDLRQIDVLEQTVPTPETYAEVATLDGIGRFLVDDALPAEATSDIVVPSDLLSIGLTVGSILMLRRDGTSELDPGDDELTRILDIDIVLDTVTVTVARGVLDTVPQEWPSGAPAWIVNSADRITDDTARAVAEEVIYKFLPVTSLRRLAESEATAHSYTLTDRFYRPYRPANVKVEGNLFESGFTLSAGSFTVSWSIRNRVTETAVVLAWTAAGVAAETGQTTTVRVLKDDIEILLSSGHTTSSYVVDVTGLGLIIGDDIVVEVYSARDGFESFQRAEVFVSVN